MAADADLATLPPPANVEADYNRDIKPLFEASCFRCHGPEKPKSRFRLDNAEMALKGGAVNTNDIVPGKSGESQLILYVAGLNDEMRMPPSGKGNPLTTEQIALLRAWIDQGARWSAESATAARDAGLSITPMVGWIGVNGSESKFREDTSLQPGFVIGFQDFELREPVGKTSEFVATGHAVFDQHDYKVAMTLTTPDVGFVNGGYTAFRKYYNDAGGYYAPFGIPPSLLNQPPFVLDQDLYVDDEKAWFTVGLTLPNLPRVAVGYEYQSRSGQESTLHWAQYSTDPNAFFGKAILPSYRNTSESTQIIKLDASYDANGFLFEDNFRGEFYRLNQSSSTAAGYFSLDGFAGQQESYSHFQAVNSFRVEKQVRPWLFVSGGFLYTHLDGDASFSGAFGSLFSPGFVEVQNSPDITLREHSYTVNVNALLGPWQGLTVSAGVQAEWEQREGLGDLFVGFDTNLVQHAQGSNLDKTSVLEELSVRYTKIPFTVLYAEAALVQESYDLNQNGYLDSAGDFLRDSDSTVNQQDYRAGFTISPWQPVSLDASYEYRDKRNNYQNEGDPNNPLYIANGYPGFFRWLDIVTDEVQAALTIRPWSWLKTTLKYEFISTEYRNNVGPALVPFFPAPVLYTGGEILSGNSDNSVYSINLTLTPWRRLYLSTSFSYTKSQLVSGINQYSDVAPSIVAPYKGDIYSVLASANYALDKITDLSLTYTFSNADYRQNNTDGLPLGIDYNRQGVLARISRRFLKNVTGALQYGFFYYNEPTSGGVNNYTAQAILASFNLRLP